MNKKYIGQIVKNLRCSRKKREDIKRQLTAEFMAALENGENEQEIMKRMGQPLEIAKDFNSSFTPEDEKQYRKEKWLSRFALIGVIVVIMVAAVYWILPKNYPIEESKIFRKEEVETLAMEVVQLLNQEEYDALQAYGTEQMQTLLNKEFMDKSKAYWKEEWGAVKEYQSIYTAQVSQMFKDSAVVQINVSYENVSVIYTLYFTEDMKLEGLWMR